MTNMSYCRHENTARALDQVWDEWHDYDENTATKYEQRGRERLIDLIEEMYQCLVDDGEI